MICFVDVLYTWETFAYDIILMLHIALQDFHQQMQRCLLQSLHSLYCFLILNLDKNFLSLSKSMYISSKVTLIFKKSCLFRTFRIWFFLLFFFKYLELMFNFMKQKQCKFWRRSQFQERSLYVISISHVKLIYLLIFFSRDWLFTLSQTISSL